MNATGDSLWGGLRGWWRQARPLQLVPRIPAQPRDGHHHPGADRRDRVALGGIGALVMVSGHGPPGRPARVLGWAAVAGIVGVALPWLVWWPGKRRSVVFVLGANLCIAVFCLTQSDHLIGLIGCTAFAVTGGYIACFHTARFMLYNFAVAGCVAAVETARYALAGDPALGAAALVLVMVLNVNVPFGFQALVHALGFDLLQSSRDPLTGLLNRRSFFERVDEQLRSRSDGQHYLTPVMIDLDRFKALNDTQGHTAGDRALVAVGRALRGVAGELAVIGRVGGEEFLLAELMSFPGPALLAERLCAAVAALPYPITASVGTAMADLRGTDPVQYGELVQQLFARADGAMYEAKRAGGDRVRHTALEH